MSGDVVPQHFDSSIFLIHTCCLWDRQEYYLSLSYALQANTDICANLTITKPWTYRVHAYSGASKNISFRSGSLDSSRSTMTSHEGS